jgi:nitrite reductase/ring-hydroxylating ferredoxin subunit
MNGTPKIDKSHIVCALADLADPGTRAFKLGTGDWPLKGFVVRKGQEVFAYLNRCPHAGHPLNWQPNDFLTHDQQLLICRSHGAQFEIATGTCVIGPCTGARLKSIPVKIEHEYVVLLDDPDDLATRFA